MCSASATLASLPDTVITDFNEESEYEEEQSRVRQMLEKEGASPGKEHLLEFLEEWERLQGN